MLNNPDAEPAFSASMPAVATAESGAKASASLYSLVQTARANEIEPYAYLRRMLAKLPKAQTVEQIEALLPWNIKLSLASVQ